MNPWPIADHPCEALLPRANATFSPCPAPAAGVRTLDASPPRLLCEAHLQTPERDLELTVLDVRDPSHYDDATLEALVLAEGYFQRKTRAYIARLKGAAHQSMRREVRLDAVLRERQRGKKGISVLETASKEGTA